MGAELESRIGQAALVRPFSAVATEFSIDEKTARAAFDTWIEDRISELKTSLPSVAGLIRLRTCSNAILVCDAERLTLFDVISALPEDSCRGRLPVDQSVAGVFCEPDPSLVAGVRALWPGARLWIDPEHILDLAQAVVSRTAASRMRQLGPDTRRQARRGMAALESEAGARCRDDWDELQMWERLAPGLDALRRAKDSFWNIWESADAEEAGRRARRWQRSAHCMDMPQLGDLLAAWGPYALPAVGSYDMRHWSLAARDVRHAGGALSGWRGAGRIQQLRGRLLLGQSSEGVALSMLPAALERVAPVRLVTEQVPTPVRGSGQDLGKR